MSIEQIARTGALAFLGLTTGCAGNQLREEAVELAKLTEEVAKTGENVAKSRNALAKARTDNLHTLEDSAARLEMEVARRSTVWRLAKLDSTAELYEGVHEAISEEAKRIQSQKAARERQAKELNEAKSATQFRTNELRGVAKRLAQLGKEMTTKEYVDFYLAFAKDVKKAIDDVKCDSASDADQDAHLVCDVDEHDRAEEGRAGP